jgi:neutral amino acid transport system permease protein
MALLLAAFILLPVVLPFSAAFALTDGPRYLAQEDEDAEEGEAEDAEEGEAEADEDAAAEEEDAGPAVRGRLSFEGEPVEGAEIVVTQDGEEIGSATTDAEGEWRVGLPGPGAYDVTLVEESLPEDVGLRDPEVQTREMSVPPGRERTVLFPLGEREGAAAVILARLGQGFYNGIKFGLIIAITSIGLSLVYGTTRLVNFAHGDLVAFGAIFAFWLNVAGPFGVQGPQIQLIPAALLAVAVGGVLGAGLEKGLWLPLRNRKTGLIQLLVISIGLSLLLRYALLFFFGGRPRPYGDYTVMSPIHLGPITTNGRDIAVILLSTLTLVAIGVMIQRTRLGKAMRAVSDNVDLAEASGIDVKRVILWVWIMAGALAALGGVFLGVVENVNWLMGFRLLLLMFAGVILGGIGTAFGAMAGGLLVGLITEMSVIFAPSELKLAWGLAALVVVLLFRPQGIFGERERIG